MKYTEKPKTIEAVQFNSHENIGEIMRTCVPRGIQYVEELGERTLFIEMPEEKPIKVRRGDYVIIEKGNFKTRRVVIVSEDEFEAKYQRVWTGSESSVGRDSLARGANPLNTLMAASGANLKLNDAGTITGIGIGVPNATTIRGIEGDPE